MAQSTKTMSDMLKLKENTKKKEYAKTRKKILEFLLAKKHVELKDLILTSGKQRFEEFLSQEGFVILHWSVGHADAEALLFLIQNLPLQLLQENLRKDDFYILRGFICGESGLEDTQCETKQRQELRIEKFKLLLSIDEDGVTTCMKENALREFCKENIKSNFSTALQQYKAKKLIL